MPRQNSGVPNNQGNKRWSERIKTWSQQTQKKIRRQLEHLPKIKATVKATKHLVRETLRSRIENKMHEAKGRKTKHPVCQKKE